MINTDKLQGIMRERKHTIRSLASAIGLSTTALFNKIHNVCEFTASEMQALRHELNFTDAELFAIFFD